MQTNIEKYKKDLDALITNGEILLNAIQRDFLPEQFHDELSKTFNTKKEISDFLKSIPSFKSHYQEWYSEALILIRQLLPDRLADFVKLYETPKKARKEVDYGNYVIEDSLYGLTVTRGGGQYVVVGPGAAIPKFTQQLNIVKSVIKRFESSLFDIKQLVRADIFDSELDAANELNKQGFTRGAGAIAGVVLEAHLLQVLENHKLTSRKKNPSIYDLNQQLKELDIIEHHVWRKIDHLTAIRNLCDHKKSQDPSKDDIDELIKGVSKIIKTIF